MKTTNLSLQILKPVVAATVAIVIICGLSVQPARANYIVTLEQVGSNVVATGTGAIDLTGLSLLGTTSALDPFINPHVGFILTGASGIQDGYSGVNGPANFGSGNGGFASSGSGDLVGIFGSAQIVAVLRIRYALIGQLDLQRRDVQQPRRHSDREEGCRASNGWSQCRWPPG